MMKYSLLKKRPSADIEGVKYQDDYSAFSHRNTNTIVIRGFPLCPECQHILQRDFLGMYWSCSECGTVWDTNTLVAAIESESKLLKSTVSIRSLEDE